MNILLRDYRPQDRVELAKLYYRIRADEFFWTDNKQLSEEDFDRWTQGERIFVAQADEKTAGFISVWEPDRFIHSLFVAREFRRIGIGETLIQKALAEYGTPLTLKCAEKNENALRFYRENGWTIVRKDTGDEGPYYLMILHKA